MKNTNLLSKLISETKFFSGEMQDNLENIIVSSAPILKTSRVSIWLYNDDFSKIECKTLFEYELEKTSYDVESLRSSDFPEYTSSHQKGNIMAVNNVYSDPRTCKIPAEYFDRHKIISLLDVPIWEQGQLKGLLSYEHTGKERQWTREEKKLAMDMGIIASFCAEADSHLETEGYLADSEKRYRALFENMPSGFVLFEVVLDELNNAVDLIILSANKKFAETTGLTVKNVIGQRLTHVLPGIEEDDAGWIKIYGRVAITGEPQQFEQRSELLGNFYSVTAYQPELNQCAVNFVDITKHKQAEFALRESLSATIEAIAKAVESRDPYTAGHQNRVSELASGIAEKMQLPKDQIKGIELGAIIHDIGKVSVPAEILNRPGKLSKAEFDLIKAHSVNGYEIIKNVNFPWPIAEMVRSHHERLDGSGYPDGLKGDEIILEAQILAVADVVEAVSSHRPYRPALGIEEGLKIVKQGKGYLYKPEIVDICVELIEKDGFKFSTTF